MAKMSGPLDASHPGQRMLIAAGLDKMAIDLDLGTAWTEASRAFVLEPVSVELGGMLKASATISLANVPREMFSINPIQSAVTATQIEAGTIDLSVRDMGSVDLGVSPICPDPERQPRSSAKGNRRRHHGQQRGQGPAIPMRCPPCRRWRALSKPRGRTLTIKLTPRGKVPAMQLFQMLKTDPLDALANSGSRLRRGCDPATLSCPAG